MFDNYQAIAADDWGDSWWNSMNTKAPPKDKAKARAWANTKSDCNKWLRALDGHRDDDGMISVYLGKGKFKPSDPIHMAVYAVACAQFSQKFVDNLIGFDSEDEDESIVNPLHLKFLKEVIGEDLSVMPIKTAKQFGAFKPQKTKAPCLHLFSGDSVSV